MVLVLLNCAEILWPEQQSKPYRGNSTAKSSGYRTGLEPGTFSATHAEDNALID